MNHIIEVNGLQKSYGAVSALRDVSFYVEEGKMFALLGPDGAGKSTTIDILSTFLKPDAGTVRLAGHVLGKEDNAIRKLIGTVFQEGVLDAGLTVEENLRYRGALYGLRGGMLQKTVKSAMAVVGLEAMEKRRYGQLSGGQRRRCDIARALVHTPRVLILDEPTTGLDPQSRNHVWNTIKKLQCVTGMTVFVTTHYMEEAEEADYVMLLDGGTIVARGTPGDLRKRYANDWLLLVPKDAARLESLLREEGLSWRQENGALRVGLTDSTEAIPLLNRLAPELASFQVIAGTMEDAFLAITGPRQEEGGRKRV
ncbi:MAG: ABC transporter ATP-binding protein [Lachnospiraceae bacterium]|nr:ABC transporter ATP-binding protein [Lachnospiraceae bacterium]